MDLGRTLRDVFPAEQTGLRGQAYAGTPLPVLCNHCANPACTRVCPTQATWKRDDGIVMMDWHRCIGCRYCMAACPYGSRSFNFVDPRPYIANSESRFPTRTKGVVEKCNFCEERLAEGKQPACVEACPEKALIFGNLARPELGNSRKCSASRFAIQRKPELGTGPRFLPGVRVDRCSCSKKRLVGSRKYWIWIAAPPCPHLRLALLSYLRQLTLRAWASPA